MSFIYKTKINKFFFLNFQVVHPNSILVKMMQSVCRRIETTFANVNLDFPDVIVVRTLMSALVICVRTAPSVWTV